MSPYIYVDMEQLRKDLAKLNRHFRDRRNNERPLESRNKREGWYYANAGGRILRARIKDIALRYRRQSGAQVMFIKPRDLK